ncbi:MFS general substrate transporter [Tothia fuscella]|uniref:MFS general substrate transporter n=1 Tax=Tothia fuscella TaxID=1048955 RepID=A0A9P4NHY4_9PEZI|nr:MFS general substrate transporter [Tothia fuscella]
MTSATDECLDKIETPRRISLEPNEKGEDGLQRAQTLAYEPRDGGYGWICCGCCFFINGHTWGINSSYGVFLAHYLASNTFPGATRLDFAFVGGLSISMAMLLSPLATYTTRRFNTRTTLLIGVLFETLSLIGASFATTTWQLFLSQGICFGWGMGFLFVGSVGIVPQWFSTKRSLANGIATAGSGIFGMVYSLATEAMIDRISLAWAFRILAILSFTVNLICAILIKDRNKQVGSVQLAFDVRLFKRPEFLLLMGYGFCSMLGYIVLLFSLPNYASSIGLTPNQGAIIGALLNLGQGLGRPPIGLFSDSIGRINMAGICTFASGLLALVIWVFADGYGVLIFYAIIGGTVAGTFWPTVGPVTAEVVGLKKLPAALSITWVVIVLPTTFSEAMALEMNAHTGSYLSAQLFTGFMYILAAICLWFLKGWKVGELERAAALEKRAVDQVDLVSDSPVNKTAHVSPLLKRMIRWRVV